MVVGGLTYAFQVSGLEINTFSGVNVIIAREPIPGPPPPAAQSLMSQLRDLMESNPRDFGAAGYDFGEDRVVVNLATARGEQLYEELTVPQGVDVYVRKDAMSADERHRITSLAFDEIDEIWGAGYEPVKDRIYLETNSISPGMLGRVKKLFGTEDVAILWEPLAEPPRLL